MANETDFSQGPFSQELTTPLYRPPQVPLNGYSTPAASIANIATNFLAGASEARMRKVMQQENQRALSIKALGNLMQMSDKMDLTPAAHAEFLRNVSKEYATQVANADTGGRGPEQGGNPLMHFIKSAAVNILGGPQQMTKAKPLDSDTLQGYFNQLHTLPKASDINAQASDLFYKGQKEVRDANGAYATEADYINNPNISGAFRMLQQHGLVEPLTQFKLAISSALQTPKTPQGVAQLGYIRDMMNPGAQGTPTLPAGAPAAPEDITPPAAATPAQAAPAQPATTPFIGPPRPADIPAGGNVPASAGSAPAPVGAPVSAATPAATPYRRLSDQEQNMIGLSGGFGKEPKNYFRNDGSVFSGVSVHDPMGRYLGAFNPNTKEIIPGAPETGPVPQKPANRQHTPEDTQKFVTDMNSAIDASPVNGKFKDSMKRSVALYARDGDFDGARQMQSEMLRAVQSGDISAQNRINVFNYQRAQNSLGDLTPNQQRIFGQEKTRFQANPDVKGYEQAMQFYDQAKAAFDRASTPGNKTPGIDDIELMRLAARMTHPNQALREGEFKSFEDALGFFNRVGVKLEKGIWDGSKLTPDAREKFKEMATTGMDRWVGAYQRQYDVLKNSMSINRMPPDAIDAIAAAPVVVRKAGTEPPVPKGIGPNKQWSPVQ
jgi:hypothetical protein